MKLKLHKIKVKYGNEKVFIAALRLDIDSQCTEAIDCFSDRECSLLNLCI